MLAHEIISFHSLFFGVFLWLLLDSPFRSVPMKPKISNISCTELMSAQRTVPSIKVVKYLLYRWIEFECVTHPNTQSNWNTGMCTDTHATWHTHSHSLKSSRAFPCFVGGKGFLTKVARFCTEWVPRIYPESSQITLIPRPLDFSHTNLLSGPCTQYIPSHQMTSNISTA